LNVFFETAKEIFLSGQFHPAVYPIAFDQDDSLPFQVKDSIPLLADQKSDTVSVLLEAGASCWFQCVEEAVIILNGCGRKVDDLKQVLENYETERPSLYPESMRDDFLFLLFVDFIDEDFRLLVCKYKKMDDHFEFEKPEIVDNENTTASVVNFVVQGWNLMYKFLSEDNNGNDEDELEQEEDDDENQDDDFINSGDDSDSKN
jgi:hypothetical protein